MKRICENCQYFREGYWCSNSKSTFFRYDGTLWLAPFATCDEFTGFSDKAPWWMRLANWIMRGRSK